MEAKIVVGTKAGKSYNIEAKEDSAAVFIGKRIGDTVNLTPLGLKGYEAKITGGSDRCGFPMRKDIHRAGRAKALMSSRTQGYKPEKAGIRVRKTVVGDVINDDISQINTVVVKEGKDPVEKLLGLDKAKEGESSEEKPKEAPEDKPQEKEKPKEAPKEEKKEAPKGEASKEASKEESKKEPQKEEKPEEKPAGEGKPGKAEEKEDKAEKK